ncbi:MAG: LytTR family DNA-binding domain-containing protein [Sedimenticola sp.]
MFENEAVDYLLKPVTEARLKQTIARLQQRIDETPKDISRLLDLLQKGEPLSQERPRLKWIKASWKDEIQLVSVEDIIYFHSGDKYTSLFTPQREYLLRTPLKELEQQLDPDAWWRIHRTTIVKVEAVKACKRDISGRLWVSLHGSDRELPVSRSFQYPFKSD